MLLKSLHRGCLFRNGIDCPSRQPPLPGSGAATTAADTASSIGRTTRSLWGYPYPSRTVQDVSFVARGARSPQPKHQTWLANGYADGPNSPFHELQLTEAERNAGGAIGRRNYSYLLSPTGQQPPDLNWEEVFDDPTRPLTVDLGCGAGRYVLLMASRRKDQANCLGIDVHAALLARANGWAAARGLGGCAHYLQANAVVAVGPLLRSYPGPVELLSIQYPDPQQRRQRHMVGRELVEALAEVLPPGAKVLLNSDFEDTAAYMRNGFERYGAEAFCPAPEHAQLPTFPCTPAEQLVTSAPPAGTWRRAGPAGGSSSSSEDGEGGVQTAAQRLQGGRVVFGQQRETGVEGAGAAGAGEDEGEDLLAFRGSWHEAGWLCDNPVGVPTEREVYIEQATGGKVYRILLIRK